MSDLVGKKVIYLKLHTPVFIPGYGNLKDTWPSDNKTIRTDMVYSGDGVKVTLNGADTVLFTSSQCAVILFERTPKTSADVVRITTAKESTA